VPATASGYPPVPRLSTFPHRRLGSSLQCASNASPSPPKIPTGQPVIRLQFPRHRHLIPARRCRRWGIPPPNPRRRGRAILPPFPVASPPRQGLLPPFPAPPPPGQGLLLPFPAPPPPGQGVPPPFPASVSPPPTPSNSCRRGPTPSHRCRGRPTLPFARKDTDPGTSATPKIFKFHICVSKLCFLSTFRIVINVRRSPLPSTDASYL
jgi:hypothetical protein